jgi:hypothetical protein
MQFWVIALLVLRFFRAAFQSVLPIIIDDANARQLELLRSSVDGMEDNSVNLPIELLHSAHDIDESSSTDSAEISDDEMNDPFPNYNSESQLTICSAPPMMIRLAISIASLLLMIVNLVNIGLCQATWESWKTITFIWLLLGSSLIEMALDGSTAIIMTFSGHRIFRERTSCTRYSQFTIAATLILIDMILSGLKYSASVESLMQISSLCPTQCVNQDLCPFVWLPEYWILYASVIGQFIISIFLEHLFGNS